MELISLRVPSRLTSSDAKPRCRGRNRRWRKSHHNKNLTAPCSLRVSNEPFESWFRVLTGERFPAESLRDTKSAIAACTCEHRHPLKNTSVFDKDNESVVLRNRDDAFVFFRFQCRFNVSSIGLPSLFGNSTRCKLNFRL